MSVGIAPAGAGIREEDAPSGPDGIRAQDGDPDSPWWDRPGREHALAGGRIDGRVAAFGARGVADRRGEPSPEFTPELL